MTFVTALIACCVPGLAAQRAPARDLLNFPLGTMDRASALGNGLGDGLGNPAAIGLPADESLAVGAAALQTTPEQGVSGQLAAVRFRLPSNVTLSLSLAHAAVADLVHTETDPQSLGDDIAYGTTLVSLAAARAIGGPVVIGGALRFRRGELELDRRNAVGADVGLYASHLPLLDASLGAATFLWQPGKSLDRQMAVNLGADARIAGRSETRQARAGYAFTGVIAGLREHYGYLEARYGAWEASGGFVRSDVHGWQPWRSRLGLTVHVAPYAVGVAREENGAGLGPTLQFTLGARIR